MCKNRFCVLSIHTVLAKMSLAMLDFRLYMKVSRTVKNSKNSSKLTKLHSSLPRMPVHAVNVTCKNLWGLGILYRNQQDCIRTTVRVKREEEHVTCQNLNRAELF